MRVTSKGQVTIPKKVREKLGVGPGSEVEFVPRTDGTVEVVGAGNGSVKGVLLRDLDRWFAQVGGSGDVGLCADEIMAMTRGKDHGDAG